MDDLAVVLQQLRLQRAEAHSPSEVTQAQVELLLARIASVTDALRGARPSETSGAATRLLLADIAMATASFRSHANEVGIRLSRALEDARLALERTADTPYSPPE